MTPQEYLEWEEQQPLKYEYVNGEAFAMTGGTIPHTAIALNLASALKNHLRDKGCKVLMADAKVMISENGPFHYPDVVVTCDSVHWCQLKLKPTVRQGLKPLSQSQSPLKRTNEFNRLLLSPLQRT